MTLTINSNITAAETRRHLSSATNGLNSSMAKLSSGSKINSAKDDAAGLQISNRLSAQSRGLEVSMRNANDAISILQVTEGSLEEYTNILNRIRDLSLQAVNGTNSKDDIESIEKEIRALGEELNRITHTSGFGGQKLLNGTQREMRFQIGSNTGEALPYRLPDLDALNSASLINTTPSSYTGDPIPPDWRTAKGDYVDFLFINNDGEKKTRIELPEKQSVEGVVNYLNSTFGNKVRFFLTEIKDDSGREASALSYSYERGSEYSGAHTFGISGERFANYRQEDGSKGYLIKGGNPLVGFGIGRSLNELINHDFSKVDDYQPTETDYINDRNSLIYMCDIISHQVNSYRADMGSTQNRLEKAINNLSTQALNIDESNSRISDTDFARMTTKMTKEKILSDATTSMLAQANNLPKSVSSLLSN